MSNSVTVWSISPKGADVLEILNLFPQKAAAEEIMLPEVELDFNYIRDRVSESIQVVQLLEWLEWDGLVSKEQFQPEFEHEE